jgi:hypothetical protein
MKPICENAVNLKLKMLRVKYWEQFQQLPNDNDFSEVKSLIEKKMVC